MPAAGLSPARSQLIAGGPHSTACDVAVDVAGPLEWTIGMGDRQEEGIPSVRF